MRKFGSCINYHTVDLIRIWKSCDEAHFEEERNRYLAAVANWSYTRADK